MFTLIFAFRTSKMFMEAPHERTHSIGTVDARMQSEKFVPKRTQLIWYSDLIEITFNFEEIPSCCCVLVWIERNEIYTFRWENWGFEWVSPFIAQQIFETFFDGWWTMRFTVPNRIYFDQLHCTSFNEWIIRKLTLSESVAQLSIRRYISVNVTTFSPVLFIHLAKFNRFLLLDMASLVYSLTVFTGTLFRCATSEKTVKSSVNAAIKCFHP